GSWPSDSRVAATLAALLVRMPGALAHARLGRKLLNLLERVGDRRAAAQLDTLPVPRLSDERDALLQAVLAAPDDDAPRLVFADWLLERGDPLGEFITLQYLVHNQRRAPTQAEFHRERVLVRAHARAWLG